MTNHMQPDIYNFFKNSNDITNIVSNKTLKTDDVKYHFFCLFGKYKSLDVITRQNKSNNSSTYAKLFVRDFSRFLALMLNHNCCNLSSSVTLNKNGYNIDLCTVKRLPDLMHIVKTDLIFSGLIFDWMINDDDDYMYYSDSFYLLTVDDVEDIRRVSSNNFCKLLLFYIIKQKELNVKNIKGDIGKFFHSVHGNKKGYKKKWINEFNDFEVASFSPLAYRLVEMTDYDFLKQDWMFDILFFMNSFKFRNTTEWGCATMEPIELIIDFPNDFYGTGSQWFDADMHPFFDVKALLYADENRRNVFFNIYHDSHTPLMTNKYDNTYSTSLFHLLGIIGRYDNKQENNWSVIFSDFFSRLDLEFLSYSNDLDVRLRIRVLLTELDHIIYLYLHKNGYVHDNITTTKPIEVLNKHFPNHFDNDFNDTVSFLLYGAGESKDKQTLGIRNKHIHPSMSNSDIYVDLGIVVSLIFSIGYKIRDIENEV